MGGRLNVLVGLKDDDQDQKDGGVEAEGGLLAVPHADCHMEKRSIRRRSP